MKLNITPLLIAVLTSCASYKGNQNFKKIENIYYTDSKIERQQGDLYIPDGRDLTLVILVHGGGWKSRNRSDMDSIAKSLASQGFAVFNMNYRFVPEHLHPSPIDDLGTAIDYLEKKR